MMDVRRELRTGEDRRRFAVYYRYGNERRNNTGNRRLDTVEELRPYFTGNIVLGCGDASDRTVEMIKEIAEAFGVPPESLEMIEHDELTDGAETFRSCDDHK
jgi:Mg2+ and Co2+ transporter CorA